MMFMKSKKLLITVLILLVIGTVGVFGMDYVAKSNFASKTPFEKLIYSSVKSMKYKSYEATQKMSMDYKIQDYNFKLDANFGIKKSGDKYNYDIAATLNGEEVKVGSVYFDAQKIILDLAEFYEKPLYLYYDEIGMLLKTLGVGEEMQNIDVKDYINILMNFKSNQNLKKVKVDDYMNIAKKYFENAITYIGDEKVIINQTEYTTEKYKMEIKNSDVILALKEALELAKQDENLKLAVKDLLVDILDKCLQNNDYEKINMTKEDVENTLKLLQEDFDTYWNQILDTLINVYTEASKMEFEGANMEYFYHLTKTGDMIKAYGTQKAEQEGVSTNMTFDSEIFNINKNVNFTKYDLQNSVNIAVETKESLQELISKITNSYVTKFTEIFSGNLQ